MSGLLSPQVDRVPGQEDLFSLFAQALQGTFGGGRGGGGGGVVTGGGPFGSGFRGGGGGGRGGPSVGSFEELIGGLSFPGPFAAGPTALQRGAVGAGQEALGLLPGIRDLATTGGLPDIEATFDIGREAEARAIERESRALGESFGLRGTRLSRGRAIGEAELRSRALETGQARRETTALGLTSEALDRRLQASQLAFGLPGQAFGLGEAERSVGDIDIIRRLSEFGDVRNLILGLIGGQQPIVSPSPGGQLLGAGTTLGAASKFGGGGGAA